MSGYYKSVGVTAVCITLVACGGGGSGGSTSPPPPSGPVPALTLVASTPASGATSVACNVAPVLDFSGNLDPATVIAANFSLTSGSSTQAVAVSVSDAQVTVTPAQKLSPLMPYTLSAFTALKGSKGEVLASTASIDFTCDGHWQSAGKIDSDNAGDAGAVKVAFDPAGNAIAVWTQSDGISNTIWADRYSPTSGWSAPAQIQSSTEEANSAALSIDGSGNALVIWDATPDGGNTNYVYASRYTAADGWSPEVQISGPAVSEGTADIAGDANGDALALWVQFDGTGNNVWGAHYTVAGGWAQAAMVSNGAGNARSSRLAMDNAGNVLSVWSQLNGARLDIWSNRYDAVTGWGTAALIETNDAGTAAFPRVKFDSLGNAVAAWTQSDGTQTNIWSNRYVAGTGWGTPVLIEFADAGNATLPRLAVNASGDAIVVWQQSDGTRMSMWSNHYSIASGWGTEIMIETAQAADASEPWVDIDSHGNALAVWTQSDGTHTTTWANRYAAGTGWGSAGPIETNSTGDSGTSVVAMDSNGAALSVWEQVDAGRDNIWANRFDF
jgi:Big-like domain-containing protein